MFTEGNERTTGDLRERKKENARHNDTKVILRKIIIKNKMLDQSKKPQQVSLKNCENAAHSFYMIRVFSQSEKTLIR